MNMTAIAEKFWKEEKRAPLDIKDKGKKEPEHEVMERPATKISLDGKKVRNGLAQLILTVVELLRELMEKQALRRIEAGALTEEQVENLGNVFMALKKEVEKLKEYFQLEDEELNLELGPLLARGEEEETGKASVVEILDRLLRKGVVVKGDIIISVADVDLISLNLGLLLASIDKAREFYAGSEVRTAQLAAEVQKLRAENVRLKQSK